MRALFSTRFAIAIIATSAISIGTANARDEIDPRAFAHGIELVKLNHKLLLLWSSWGNPPNPKRGVGWEHDIYYSWLDQARAELDPQLLVHTREAQEPVSAAVNQSGKLLATCEDGADGINQYAGLWDSQLTPLKPYPIQIGQGGHSGHVAALGDNFLVVYSEGWTRQHAAKSFRGLGNGKDIWARWVDTHGTPKDLLLLSGNKRGASDDWPLLAASNKNFMMIWQRFPARTLMAALVDARGHASKPFPLIKSLKTGYHYDVAYAPKIDRYVVVGTQDTGGFVIVIGTDGHTKNITTRLPHAVAEARVVVSPNDNRVMYPAYPNGIVVAALSDAGSRVVKTITVQHPWDVMGTTGLWLDDHHVLFATLTKAGVKLIPVNPQ